MSQNERNSLGMFVLNELGKLNGIQPIDCIEGVGTRVAGAEALHDSLCRAGAERTENDFLCIIHTSFGDVLIGGEHVIHLFRRLLRLFRTDRANVGYGAGNRLDLGFGQVSQDVRGCRLTNQNEECRRHCGIAGGHRFFSSFSQTRTSRATVSGSCFAWSTTRLRIISMREDPFAIGSMSLPAPLPISSNSEAVFPEARRASSCLTVKGVCTPPRNSPRVECPSAVTGTQPAITDFCNGRMNRK